MPVLVFVVLVIVALPGLARSELVTVICDDPKGFELRHGPSYPELPDSDNEATMVDKFGSKPTFILDLSDPQYLTILWGSMIHPKLPEDFIDLLDLRAKAEKARIVYHNEHQITALNEYEGGVNLYTLYPKLGYGVFTSHRNNTRGGASPYMYYGPCTFHK